MSKRRVNLIERKRRREILKNIGHKCREYRHTLMLTMADVSEKTGYSIGQISKFERGQTDSAVILSMYTELTAKETKNDQQETNL